MTSLRRVLVALDLSPASLAALNRARTLVERGGELHLLHVVASLIETTAPSGATPEEMEQYRHQLEGEARGRLEELAKTVSESEVTTSIVIAYGNPADKILATATRVSAGVIAMGSHGKNVFDRVLIGSVAEEVTRRSLIPTLVVREPPSHSPAVDRVVVAVDLHQTSREPAVVASAVARRLGRPLEALHVIDARDLPVPVMGGFEPGLIGERARTSVEAAPLAVELALREAGVFPNAIRIVSGTPETEIARYVTERDLLVCGTRGRGAFGRFVFGSVTAHALRHAPCPVLVVHPGGVATIPHSAP